MTDALSGRISQGVPPTPPGPPHWHLGPPLPDFEVTRAHGSLGPRGVLAGGPPGPQPGTPLGPLFPSPSPIWCTFQNGIQEHTYSYTPPFWSSGPDRGLARGSWMLGCLRRAQPRLGTSAAPVKQIKQLSRARPGPRPHLDRAARARCASSQGPRGGDLLARCRRPRRQPARPKDSSRRLPPCKERFDI